MKPQLFFVICKLYFLMDLYVNGGDFILCSAQNIRFLRSSNIYLHEPPKINIRHHRQRNELC